MGRRPCSERLNAKMRNWTEEEDVKKTGIMKRGGKSCRLKWSNCSGHDDSFTPEEEDLIVRLHAAIGSRWSMIAQQLPGRTDNDVKNCWNTKLRKKLSEKGIDPVTHKPFSQVLADYANIGTLPEAETSTPQTASNNSFIFMNPNQFQIPLQQQGLLSNSTAHLPTLTNPTPENSALSFAWRDFLIEDPFPAGDARQAENYEMIQREEEKRNNSVVASEEMSLNFTNNNGFEASSSSNYSDTSFVEAMLDRQKDMLLEFPGVLEESFFY